MRTSLTSLAVVSVLLLPGSVDAQTAPPEPENATVTPPTEPQADRQPNGYAWGSPETAQAPATHRFAQVHATLGAGVSLRLTYDDVAPPAGLGQGIIAPPYLQLRAAYLFEGDGDLQHGVGLGVSTILTSDPEAFTDVGYNALGQWTLTPSYVARLWLGDEVQLMGTFGIPIVLGGDVSLGLELSVGIVWKFLHGLGVYAMVVPSIYFGAFEQPLLSADAGLVFDYELMP